MHRPKCVFSFPESSIKQKVMYISSLLARKQSLGYFYARVIRWPSTWSILTGLSTISGWLISGCQLVLGAEWKCVLLIGVPTRLVLLLSVSHLILMCTVNKTLLVQSLSH